MLFGITRNGNFPPTYEWLSQKYRTYERAVGYKACRVAVGGYLPLGTRRIYVGRSRHSAVTWLWFLS